MIIREKQSASSTIIAAIWKGKVRRRIFLRKKAGRIKFTLTAE
jgi:hypothetical protein